MRILARHHTDDMGEEQFVRSIFVERGGRAEEVRLAAPSAGETGAALRALIGMRDQDDLLAAPKGHVEDFVVQPEDVVCLSCVEKFYVFPREVNGG